MSLLIFSNLPHIPYFTKKLNKSSNKFLIEECQLTPVYNYPCKLNSIIKFQKDKIKTVNKVNSVYKIDCMDCDKCYVGQSQRLVSTRRDQHQKNLNHDPKKFYTLKITGKKRKIAEMYYIKKDGSSALNEITDLHNFPPCYDPLLNYSKQSLYMM